MSKNAYTFGVDSWLLLNKLDALIDSAEREQASNARGSKVARTKSVKQLAFTSAGHSSRTEWLYTANSANAPTLIILPGSGGIEETGGFFRDMASREAFC